MSTWLPHDPHTPRSHAPRGNASSAAPRPVQSPIAPRSGEDLPSHAPRGNEDSWLPTDIEPERYEFFETPAWAVNRRDFFRIAGAGLVVALWLGETAPAQPPGRRGGRGGGGNRGPAQIGAWLHIGEDGAVTVYTGKVEIGQNIRTSLTQGVAEELRVPVERITMVMADTDRVPDDGGTSGSQSTPRTFAHLRRVASAAREALVDMAAEQAKLDRDQFIVADGKVTARTGPSFTYGQLTHGKKLVKAVAADTPGTNPRRWTVAGTSVPKVDGRAIVTGGHQYASDIRRPGMLFGRILRPAAFRAKLKSVTTKDAEALPDVKVVRDGEFVGVVAPTAQAAADALAAIQAEWQTVPQVSAADLFQHLKEQRSQGRGGGGFGGRGGPTRKGSVADALKTAAHTVKSTYTVAYIAHVPLEPRVAVAEWDDGKLTVWTGTQQPFRVRSELAGAFSLPEEKVRVIVPDMGSGYGGKHTGDAAVEAARLAKAAGKPVKVAWTREEEFTWAYFRPAGVIDVSAGVTGDGTLTAWEFHNYNSGGSAIGTPYDVANQVIEFHGSDYPLRQGSYRALASTANTFARESAMDDLAAAAGLDPLAFRLKNLKEPRLRAVTAFECGAVLNPDHLKNQIEGAVTMGLGGALFERIDFADGKVLNANFAEYRLPRFKDAPAQEVVLI
ncbi:MAG TPA: molybdopterin cofactor-binding domain-containing protein, partial [Gemmataceae bacterium]